jgi:hypothetical protein
MPYILSKPRLTKPNFYFEVNTRLSSPQGRCASVSLNAPWGPRPPRAPSNPNAWWISLFWATVFGKSFPRLRDNNWTIDPFLADSSDDEKNRSGRKSSAPEQRLVKLEEGGICDLDCRLQCWSASVMLARDLGLRCIVESTLRLRAVMLTREGLIWTPI